MRFIADFHIHSRFSRATSKEITTTNLARWAQIKGISVLGTGDFTHPLWLKELKTTLEPAESGLFKLKPKWAKGKFNNDYTVDAEKTRFILTTEISCIYSKNNRVRKVHILIVSPTVEAVEKINTRLEWIGNLKADGRPILGLDAKELLKIVLQISPASAVIPAHAWTPWFSLFGSKSGFNSLEECFEEYSKYIFAIETGLSCYDDKTEVLTKNGWKQISKINYSDQICTLDNSSGIIQFQKPLKVFRYMYNGKMYRLKTKRVDLLVTPNHNLFVSGCDFRKPPKFSLKEAQFLFNKAKRFKKDGIWIGTNPKLFILPAVQIKHGSRFYKGSREKKAKHFRMESWLKFFGFWIAEGWTTKGRGGDYNVCLSNRDIKLIFEMKRILEDFGYNTFWNERTSTLRVRDYQLFHYLKQFGKCLDKFVPQEVKLLSKEYLKIFLKYYIKGDGHIYGRNRKGLSATTTSVRLRDDLQEIALMVGMSAYYKLHRKKGTLFKSPGQKYKKFYKQRNDSWVIYFIRKNIHAVVPSAVKKHNYTESWVNFNGQVYCVTVPNHIIYIRRNGIPVWCGNSDPAMNWRISGLDRLALISNSDCHSSQKMGREANVFDTDLSYRAIMEAIKQKNTKKFLQTIEFFPEEGKYHLDGHRACDICFSPSETKKNKGECPKCRRPLTIGVLNRVDELADRAAGAKPVGAIPFKSLVPLEEIIADALGVSSGTKKVIEEYQNLIRRFGNEFTVLLETKIPDLIVSSLPEIAEGIQRVRDNKLTIDPGYDGVYGKVRIFSDGEQKTVSKQKSLF